MENQTNSLFYVRSLLMLGLFLLLFPFQAWPETFTVTNTNSSGPGSFTQAVFNAASNGDSEQDIITFDIPETDRGYNGSWWVINTPPPVPTTGTISNVVIDGYSQPGASMNTAPCGGPLNTSLKIQINFTYSWWGMDCYSNTIIRGTALTSTGGGYGIILHGTESWIYGCFFGVLPDGKTPLWTAWGYQIWTASDSSGNIIGNNGDGQNDNGEINVFGKSIDIATPQNINVNGGWRFSGNYFGVGAYDLETDIHGNSWAGIAINGGHNSIIEGNIFGFLAHGVHHLDSGDAQTIIKNNYFGTDPSGALHLGNMHGYGCKKNTSNVIIENNLFAYQYSDALYIAGGDHFVVRNNEIRDNQGDGIAFWFWGDSIATGPSHDNLIIGNRIFNNGGSGITMPARGEADYRNTFSQNAIFNNTGLGIDLGGDGVTLNDRDDADSGPNGLLNFPVFDSINIEGSNLVLSGFTRPGTTIELFIAEPDPSGFGEGKTCLATFVEGSAEDADDTTGTYPPPHGSGEDTTNRFLFTIPAPSGLTNDTVLTATATDTDGNTSEFGPLIKIPGSTLIDLANLSATPSDREVIIRWATESEIDNAGFNIYRAPAKNSGYEKINHTMIAAQGSSSAGATYQFMDDDVGNRKTYYYQLEAIDIYGVSSFYGPVSATPRWIYGIDK